MAKASFYTVLTSIVGTLEGYEVEYHKGEVVDGDDPAVALWPACFGPLVVRDHRRSLAPVEQATAAPGETRKALTTSSVKGG